jgi:type IV pilus assembly protein PilO
MAPPTKPSTAKQPQTFAAQPAAVKVMLGAFLVAVLGAGYYFALHTPLEEALQQEQGQYAQLQQQFQQAQERQREYIRLREELASREGLDRANMRVLPEEAEIAAFLQDLNRLAETSGLQMRMVEPRPEEPDTHFVRLPVALRVRGRYHQLARFFYNVSRLERAISMQNIELRDPRTTPEEVALEVQMLATTYRRPAAEAAPGAPSP